MSDYKEPKKSGFGAFAAHEHEREDVKAAAEAAESTKHAVTGQVPAAAPEVAGAPAATPPAGAGAN